MKAGEHAEGKMDIVPYEYNSTSGFSWGNETLSDAIKILEKIELYYVPFLVAFGTIGNWLSVVVFFSTKLRKLSSSFYLAALAVSDTGFLMVIFISWLNMVDISIFNQPVFCELSIYLSSVCSFLSVWFVVAFTVERFIAVGYPLKRPSMCTVSRAKMVIASLTAAALLFYMPHIFISGLEKRPDRVNNQTMLMCELKEEYKQLYNILNGVDFFIVLILPFFAISFINTSICVTVWKLARIRRAMTSSLHGGTANGMPQRPAIRTTSSLRSQNSQAKVTKMLLIVSTVFICLNLPSYILRSALHFQEKTATHSDHMIAWQHASLILFHTNFGINFVLYCVSGQNFRKALGSLCCPRRRTKTNDTTRVTGLDRTQATPWYNIHVCRRLPADTRTLSAIKVKFSAKNSGTQHRGKRHDQEEYQLRANGQLNLFLRRLGTGK